MKIKEVRNKSHHIWRSVYGTVFLFFMRLWFFIGNMWFLVFATKSRYRIFTGWMHFWMAKYYADKRTRWSKVNKVCGGKRHYVLPWTNYGLIVINKLELVKLKKLGYFSKNLDIIKVLESSYYLSK
jgi:hypothetical protein